MLKKTLIFIIVISLIISCYKSKKEFEEEGDKQFEELLTELKNNFNLTLNTNNYKVEHGGTITYTFTSEEYYVIRKKDKQKYRSKYFLTFGNETTYISPFSDTYNFSFKKIPEIDSSSEENTILMSSRSRTMFRILSLYGLKPYVLNELLYDKSKGNDFSKIEKIFDESGKINIRDNMNDGWSCDEIKDALVFMTTLDKCKVKYKNDNQIYDNYEKIEKYDSLFWKYFIQGHKLETINWYNFLKFNNITPILIFELSPETTDNEMRKIRDKIIKHYNKKEILIKLCKKKTGFEKGKENCIW